jgi:hypothetical protein
MTSLIKSGVTDERTRAIIVTPVTPLLISVVICHTTVILRSSVSPLFISVSHLSCNRHGMFINHPTVIVRSSVIPLLINCFPNLCFFVQFHLNGKSMNDDRTINKSGITPDRTTTVGLIMTALCTFNQCGHLSYNCHITFIGHSTFHQCFSFVMQPSWCVHQSSNCHSTDGCMTNDRTMIVQ